MRRGFKIFTTQSGAGALNLHQEHHFVLILCDFKLEDMSGCTLCSLIRNEENLEHVPFILTCHNIPGSIERVEQCGATAMLLKPINPINLLETIGSSLGIQLVRSKRVVLHVRVLSMKYDLKFFCFSHDISNTGILLETHHELSTGNRIICQFNLDDSCQIETEGEVIRSMTASEDTDLYGVKFIAMPLSSRRAIDNYIASSANAKADIQKIGCGDSQFN